MSDLHLLVAHVCQVAAVRRLGRVLRVDVQVLQHDGLAERRLVVDPGAPLSVAARADLEVEGAIDLVLLSAEDGGQVLGHREPLEVEPTLEIDFPGNYGSASGSEVYASLATFVT